MGAAVRKTLHDAYEIADKRDTPAPLDHAAFKISNAVRAVEESAEKKIDERIRMERENKQTDIYGNTPTEEMTGEFWLTYKKGPVSCMTIDPKKAGPFEPKKIDLSESPEINPDYKPSTEK